MALADADHKFIWVDIGVNGSASKLKEVIENGSIGFPAANLFPNDDSPTDTLFYYRRWRFFLFRTGLMKPYSRHNLPYSTTGSGGRRVVVNAFGTLSNRFRCLLTNMQQTSNVLNPSAWPAVICIILWDYGTLTFRMPPWIKRTTTMELFLGRRETMQTSKTWITLLRGTVQQEQLKYSSCTWRITKIQMMIQFHDRAIWSEWLW